MTAAPSPLVRRVLPVLSIAEILTVSILLVNLWTVHVRPVTQVVGPVHGAIYLSVVVVALIAPGLRPIERIVGCLPIIGGPLASVLSRRRSP